MTNPPRLRHCKWDVKFQSQEPRSKCVSSSLRQTDAVLSFYRDVITWVDPDRELKLLGVVQEFFSVTSKPNL